MADARLCPVPTCGAPLKRGHLMCRDCWGRVPRFLQVAVNRSWAAYSRGGFDRNARLAAYQRHADQAVAEATARLTGG